MTFPTYIKDARAGICCFSSKFFEKIEAIGYEKVLADNPKQAIFLMLSKIQPQALHSKMQTDIRLDPSLEKIVPKVLALTFHKAVWCLKYGAAIHKPQKNRENPGRYEL